MKTSIIAAILVAVSGPAIAADSDYYFIGAEQAGKSFVVVDAATYKQPTGFERQAWFSIVNVGEETKQKGFKTSLLRVTVNCPDDSLKISSVIYYDTVGAVVNSQDIPFPQPTPIAPNSVGAQWESFLCEDYGDPERMKKYVHFGKVDLAPTIDAIYAVILSKAAK